MAEKNLKREDLFWKAITRKKDFEVNRRELAVRFNTFDLTALGVGSTLGVGVYVLAGEVALTTAGPSVVLSFLVAALASVISGICYAEFGARVPRAGSAYIYAYVTVGELIAFIIGWNLVLEYVIGSASVARGFSAYLDSLLGNQIIRTFNATSQIPYTGFTAEYFDWLAFTLVITVGAAIAFGLQHSKHMNNFCTLINLSVVSFVIIAGIFFIHPEYWFIHQDLPANAGEGGFFPFGIIGSMKGAAVCFFAFVGFDTISASAEEAKNPKKSIPIAIVVSLIIICVAYLTTSAVVTLMQPYYLLDEKAALAIVFQYNGFDFGRMLVNIGGVFGLCASLFGAMFPMPRIVYAMAKDGLLFKCIGYVAGRFQTPTNATIVSTLFTAMFAGLFELRHLIEMMSIGTLMAYFICSACVILLRYDHSYMEYDDTPRQELTKSEKASLVFQRCFNVWSWRRDPTVFTRTEVNYQVTIYCLLAVGFCVSLRCFSERVAQGNWVSIMILAGFLVMMLWILVSIDAQPINKYERLYFKVPLVPYLPGLAIIADIYLMVMLQTSTWVRFAVWMSVGLLFYFISLKLYDRMPTNDEQHQPKPTQQKLSIKNGQINFSFEPEERVADLNLTVKRVEIVADQTREQQMDSLEGNRPVAPPESDSDSDTESSEIQVIADVHRAGGDNNLDGKPWRLEDVEAKDVKRFVENRQVGERKHDIPEEIERQLASLDYADVIEFVSSLSDSCGRTSDEEAIAVLNKVISEEEHKQALLQQEEIQRVASNLSLASLDVEGVEEEIKQRVLSSFTFDAEPQEEQNVIINIENDVEEVEEIQVVTENVVVETVGSIPPPPPITQDFKLTPPPTPIEEKEPPLVNEEELGKVVLKQTAASPKKKMSDVSINDNFSDNVKSGTKEMEKIKSKLLELYKEYRPPVLPNYQPLMARAEDTPAKEPEREKTPSPEVELPEDYAKSFDFKEKLSGLILQQSVRVKEQKNANSFDRLGLTTKDIKERRVVDVDKENVSPEKVEETEITLRNIGKIKLGEEGLDEHKVKMLGTLRSIKMRSVGKIAWEGGNAVYDSAKDLESDKDKQIEEHKKRMMGTLRSIKLRRTGILGSQMTEGDDSKSIR